MHPTSQACMLPVPCNNFSFCPSILCSPNLRSVLWRLQLPLQGCYQEESCCLPLPNKQCISRHSCSLSSCHCRQHIIDESCMTQDLTASRSFLQQAFMHAETVAAADSSTATKDVVMMHDEVVQMQQEPPRPTFFDTRRFSQARRRRSSTNGYAA